MAIPHAIEVLTEDGNMFRLSPLGRSYTEGSELITREDRAASGKLRRDIIAEKKTFTLSYDVIDVSELEVFENLLTNYADNVLTLFVYRMDGNGNNIKRQYSVLIREFSRKRVTKALWDGVTVEFVEV
jgi:hypothetical protein